tara:strand:- start:681 stop:1994 length:1314 start_codon:yes stop_codon:yes gene_type:complete
MTRHFFKKLYYDIVPFHRRYGKEFKKTLDIIEETQWYSLKELKQYQLNQLNKLLNHSYETVPYYTKVFKDLNLTPDDINSTKDLSKLPILTKDIIRNNWDDLQSTKSYTEKVYNFSTSGSTGNPLTFLGNDDVYKREAAFILRAYRSHGANLYDTKSIWLRRYVPGKNEPLYKYDDELKRMYLSAYHLSKDNIEDYVSMINSYNSELLVAYPSSIYILALLMENNNLKLKNIKYIHTASEKMLPQWSNKVEEVLGIKPKSHYGMMEKVSMFFQCDHSDMYHESLEYGVTEIVDNYVVGTGFLNYTMPFIRYKTNDVATKNTKNKKCKCGRGLPLSVKDFDGRSDDILITKDGRYIPAVNFYTMMYKLNNIDMFQIIQRKRNKIDVNIKVKEKFNQEKKLKKELENRLGSIKLNINYVDNIERDKNTQKIRCIVNECI